MTRKQYLGRLAVFVLVALIGLTAIVVVSYWMGHEGFGMPIPNPTALLGVALWVALGLAVMAFLAPTKWVEARPGRAKLVERSRKTLVVIAAIVVGAWLLLDVGFDPRGLLRSVFDPGLVTWVVLIIATALWLVALWAIAAGVPYPLRKWWEERKSRKAQRRADKAAKTGATPRVSAA